jgi:uncharacterized protein YcsI (UPF0317 family)
MRPTFASQVSRDVPITARYLTVHEAPAHIGHPGALGIADLPWPDFGDPVTVRQGEEPISSACGVTPRVAAREARLDRAGGEKEREQ